MAEQADQQRLGEYLRQRGKQNPAGERPVQRGQGKAHPVYQYTEKQKREGKPEAETHEGRARRSDPALQVFL